jgi:hypothetical protein
MPTLDEDTTHPEGEADLTGLKGNHVPRSMHRIAPVLDLLPSSVGAGQFLQESH